MSKLSILREFAFYLKARRKILLVPIVIILLLLAVLILVTQGSALAPFVYPLF